MQVKHHVKTHVKCARGAKGAAADTTAKDGRHDPGTLDAATRYVHTWVRVCRRERKRMGEPNNALGALIQESGLSWAGLARRVNDLGRNEGLALRYDYTGVNRWVKRGERPRQPVPSLIARILSERLARSISPSDFGMETTESLAARGLRYSADPETTVRTISDLGKAEVTRRGIMTAPFILAALAAPSRDWLLATLESTSGDRGPRQVGMTQVAGIRDMFALFQEMDVMRGGGHARTALIEYMNSYVTPLLRQQNAPEVQRALYDAAAEQAYLIGWMAYDDGQHGLAERYLIQALGLAQAAGNNILGAHVLAGMSDQANLLGHPQEAVALARAGRRGISVDDSPACMADLQILEARALAALGDQRAAAVSVASAERTFNRVDHENEPAWARFIDRAYLFGEAAHCFRDLAEPSQIDRFAGESLDAARSQGRARRGALSETALAISELSRGNVEAAADKAVKVVRLAASVNSSRCLEAVSDLNGRFRPYNQVAGVQEFRHQANELLGIAA